MGRKVKQLKNYTTEQVEHLFESDENNIVGVKLYAIIQLTRGYSTRKLQEFYRVTHKQICNWADRFDSEGIEGLRMKAGRGRHSRLNEDQKYRLLDDLLKSPEVFGYNTSNWSGSLMREHIQKIYQVDYKPAAVYNLMHELGFSFQRAKGFYPERNEKKREEFKTDIKNFRLLRRTFGYGCSLRG
jgi:transposase